MFNKEGFKEIGKDIFVYNNFIYPDECDQLIQIADNLPEEDWINPHPQQKDNMEFGKISIELLISIKNRLKDLLQEDVYIGDNISPIRMRKGSKWGTHSDNVQYLNARNANKLLKNDEEFKLVQNSLYGIIMYFNDFEGGSLYYPNQNNLEYKPLKGDLVIHSAEDHCFHGVNEVKSKVRYTHSNHIYELIKVPKDFNVV